jgi:hypothetical protein
MEYKKIIKQKKILIEHQCKQCNHDLKVVLTTTNDGNDDFDAKTGHTGPSSGGPVDEVFHGFPQP